jgi:transposase-like protein
LIKEENEFIGHSHNIFLQMAKDFVEVCPKCNSNNISIRKRKTPKYRCQECKNEFDDPNAQIVNKNKKQKHEYRQEYSNPDD